MTIRCNKVQQFVTLLHFVHKHLYTHCHNHVTMNEFNDDKNDETIDECRFSNWRCQKNENAYV